MSGIRTVLLVVAALGIGLGAAGCREEEQDRVLLFKKGKYLGPPDTALTAKEIDSLNKRAGTQKY
jgi:hypothetical protein